MRHNVVSVSRLDDFYAVAPWEITFNQSNFPNLNSLLRQISKDQPLITTGSIENFFRSGGTLVLAVTEDKIVGMASLVTVTKVNGQTGRVEHVVVEQDHQGNGIARKMMQRILEIAHSKQLRFVDLTTESSRVAANGLYVGLGFVKRDTNPYRFYLL